MGAESFYCVAEGTDMAKAFLAAVGDAHYWHGHNGYTGTICEKPGFVDFSIDPTPSLVEAEDIFYSLEQNYFEEHPLAREKFGDSFDKVFDLFNDKWGYAVGFKLNDGTYFFCGFASC